MTPTEQIYYECKALIATFGYRHLKNEKLQSTSAMFHEVANAMWERIGQEIDDIIQKDVDDLRMLLSLIELRETLRTLRTAKDHAVSAIVHLPSST